MQSVVLNNFLQFSSENLPFPTETFGAKGSVQLN
jgi:hypothetical protein